MPFEFTERPSVDGEWVSVRDLAKIEAIVTVADGFLTSDDANTFEGKPAPSYIVKGVSDDETEIKTRVRKGYSRDAKLEELAEYLQSNPNETVAIKFVKTQGSAYIDVATA